MSCLHLDITIISIHFPPHEPPINPTQKRHLPFLTPPKTSSAFDQSESKKIARCNSRTSSFPFSPSSHPSARAPLSSPTDKKPKVLAAAPAHKTGSTQAQRPTTPSLSTRTTRASAKASWTTYTAPVATESPLGSAMLRLVARST